MKDQTRKLILYVLIPLSVLVALYCCVASLSSGSSYVDRNGEPHYIPPVHHSSEFYQGLRWSVMLSGTIMALMSYNCKYPKLALVFGFAAALFNPILPIHMPKHWWEFIDGLVFLLFLIGPGYLWPNRDANLPP